MAHSHVMQGPSLSAGTVINFTGALEAVPGFQLRGRPHARAQLTPLQCTCTPPLRGSQSEGNTMSSNHWSPCDLYLHAIVALYVPPATSGYSYNHTCDAPWGSPSESSTYMHATLSSPLMPHRLPGCNLAILNVAGLHSAYDSARSPLPPARNPGGAIGEEEERIHFRGW